MPAVRSIIVILCVLANVNGEDPAAPPAFSHAGGNGVGTGKSCRYEFTVPDKAGMCNSGNAALEGKIDKVKEDLDRTRLQYVSQNTILQDQMSKIQNNVNSYGSQINDLYDHIRQIQSQMTNLPSSQGPGTNELQKLVETAKDNFNKALRDMENRLFNITYNFQKDAIEQSKVNAAVEMQVRLVEERAQKTEENIKDLLQMVTNIQSNPNSSPASSNVSPAILNDVRNRLKNFDSQVKMYDQLQQDQFSALQMKSNSLALQLANHSHLLNDLAVESQAMLFRVSSAEQKASTVSSELDDFQNTNLPKINKLETDMTRVQADTADLKSQLGGVATKAMNADIHSLQDATKISDLQTRATLLTSRIHDILGQLSNQSSAIDDLSNDLHTLSSTLDPTQLQAMQAALDGLKNTGTIGSVTQTQLKQVENEIQTLNKMVADLQKAPPALVEPTSPPSKPPTDQPFVVPTKKQPFIVPTLPHTKPTAPQPFVIPTKKQNNAVPTTHKPLTSPSTTQPFIVPTRRPKTLGEVTDKPFVVPPKPFVTPKLKIPTPPAFKIPTLPNDSEK